MTPVEQVSVNFTYNYRALPQAVRWDHLLLFRVFRMFRACGGALV